jgi:hypothetical protein
MKNKVLKMKEAAAFLGISVKTLQRLADAWEVECVTNPYGWRRGITEEEVIRLKNKLLARAKKRVPKPKPPTTKKKVEITATTEPKEAAAKVPTAPEAPTLPAEISMRQAVDMLTPSTIGERSVFRDLLSAATLLGSFTPQQLSEKIQYPLEITEALCQRLIEKGLAVKQGENFVLKVRIVG